MFKQQFKYYKSRRPPPDLSSVIDLKSEFPNAKPFALLDNDVPASSLLELGLQPAEEWKAFELTAHPGLIVILNPFTPSGQKMWVRRCISSYAGPPNKMNIHLHGDLGPSENWWEACHSIPERKPLLKKLRWVTMGYHHDWDTKVYSDANRTELPQEVGQLCAAVDSLVFQSSFTAEAVIVNYYHMDSTLAGHTDHSEPNLSAPLYSFSFGQSAIFMLGGRSLDDQCSALLLRSGDVVVMSRESRLSYHAVPRILPAEDEPWIGFEGRTEDWKDFENYLESSRINLNVRQVLANHEKALPSLQG